VNTPALTDTEIQQVLRILRRNGQSASVVRKVADRYHIAESLVRSLGTVITEGVGSNLTETTAPAPDARELHQQRRAEQLAERVNAAESRPLSEASTQELEALVAAYYKG